MKIIMIVMLWVLAAAALWWFSGPAQVNDITNTIITGVVEKVEWLESGRCNMMVIKFEDGRSIKLRSLNNNPLIFHYGKEHAFAYDNQGLLRKMEVVNSHGKLVKQR